VLNMDWYGIKYPKLSSDQNDFDMLLKFQSLLAINNQPELRTFKFTDGQDNEYFLQYRALELVPNTLVKVRSVLKMFRL